MGNMLTRYISSNQLIDYYSNEVKNRHVQRLATLQDWKRIITTSELYSVYIRNVWEKLLMTITKSLSIQIKLFLAGQVVVQLCQISSVGVIPSPSY